MNITFAIWLHYMVCEHLIITPVCGSSPNCFHKKGSTQLSRISLQPVACSSFTPPKLRGPNLFHQDNAPAHTQTSSMKTPWFAKGEVAEPAQTPLNAFGMNWSNDWTPKLSAKPHECSCNWMNTNPHSHTPKSRSKLSQKSGVCYDKQGGLTVKWDVQKVHMSVMVRWPYSSVYHITKWHCYICTIRSKT